LATLGETVAIVYLSTNYFLFLDRKEVSKSEIIPAIGRDTLLQAQKLIFDE